MSVLLDTNVISELARRRPNTGVMDLLNREPHSLLSVITLHELTFGAVQVSDPNRRKKLLVWIENIETRFRDSLIPVSSEIARLAAELRAGEQHQGRVFHVEDALIAATAAHHSLTLITRNTKDFENLDIPLLNPFTSN